MNSKAVSFKIGKIKNYEFGVALGYFPGNPEIWFDFKIGDHVCNNYTALIYLSIWKFEFSISVDKV